MKRSVYAVIVAAILFSMLTACDKKKGFPSDYSGLDEKEFVRTFWNDVVTANIQHGKKDIENTRKMAQELIDKALEMKWPDKTEEVKKTGIVLLDCLKTTVDGTQLEVDEETKQMLASSGSTPNDLMLAMVTLNFKKAVGVFVPQVLVRRNDF